MAYAKKTWENRQSEYPNRRRLTPVSGLDGIYEIAREEGLVVEEGDPFDQMSMNAMEGRVEAAFAELTSGAVKAGKAVVADRATNADRATSAASADRATSAASADRAANADNAGAVTWAAVSGKPASYPATAHTHTATYAATIGTAANQNIGVSGITAADNPVIDVVLSGDYGTDIARLEAWGNVTRIVTYNGGITVVCYDAAPTVAIPIQIKAVR